MNRQVRSPPGSIWGRTGGLDRHGPHWPGVHLRGDIIRPPDGVNFTALPIRLINTCWSLSRSANARPGEAGGKTASSTPFCCGHLAQALQPPPGCSSSDGDARGMQLDAAGLDPRQVQQVGDEADQAVGVALDPGEVTLQRRGHLSGDAVQQVVHRHPDGRERSPQLVGDVGHELRLETIERLELLVRGLQGGVGLGQVAGALGHLGLQAQVEQLDLPVGEGVGERHGRLIRQPLRASRPSPSPNPPSLTPADSQHPDAASAAG